MLRLCALFCRICGKSIVSKATFKFLRRERRREQSQLPASTFGDPAYRPSAIVPYLHKGKSELLAQGNSHRRSTLSIDRCRLLRRIDHFSADCSTSSSPTLNFVRPSYILITPLSWRARWFYTSWWYWAMEVLGRQP